MLVEPHKIEDFLLARGWVLGLWLGRRSRERSTALSALQIVEVQAQKISRLVNDVYVGVSIWFPPTACSVKALSASAARKATRNCAPDRRH